MGVREDGVLVEAARKADDFAGQHHVHDLPLAGAQQLVADGDALLDDVQRLVLVALDDDVLGLAGNDAVTQQPFERRQVLAVEPDRPIEPRDEGMEAVGVHDGADYSASSTCLKLVRQVKPSTCAAFDES